MCAGFLLVDSSIPSLALLFALGGLYIAMVDSMEGALTADLLPAAVRGTGYGVLGAVNGAGDLISSIAVGLLWAKVSITSGFLYAIALTLIGGMALFRLRPTEKSS
jgi:hypothetical protein